MDSSVEDSEEVDVDLVDTSSSISSLSSASLGSDFDLDTDTASLSIPESDPASEGELHMVDVDGNGEDEEGEVDLDPHRILGSPDLAVAPLPLHAATAAPVVRQELAHGGVGLAGGLVPEHQQQPQAPLAADEESGQSSFQSPTRKRPKPPEQEPVPGPSTLAALHPSIASECPICFDPWTTNGPHRVISLKCGHLFGHGCIVRWIARSSTCPSCKGKALTRDIRPVFANMIQALDSAELEELKELKRKAARTIDKQSRELSSLREAYARDALILECMRKEVQQQVQVNQQLKTEIERLKWSFGQYQEGKGMRVACSAAEASASAASSLHTALAATSLLTPAVPALAPIAGSSTNPTSADVVMDIAPAATITTSSSASSNIALAPAFVPPVIPPFTLRHCVPIYAHPHSARVLEPLPSSHSILLSKAAAPTNHGVLRLNLVDPAFQHFLPLHTACVRDIAVSPGTGTHMLTTSLDRSLVLTSLSSNKACHAFALEAPGWSCCFDATDPNYLYAGLANNTILTYDVRVPDRPVHRIMGETHVGGVGKAIHSLRSVVDERTGYRGLLGGSMTSTFLVHDASGHGPYRCTGEGAAGHVAERLLLDSGVVNEGGGGGDSCFSVAFDGLSGHWISSWRSRTGTTHHVGTLARRLRPGNPGTEVEGYTFHRSASLASLHVSAQLTRSSLLSGHVHAAGSGEGAGAPLLALSGEVPGTVQVWRGSWLHPSPPSSSSSVVEGGGDGALPLRPGEPGCRPTTVQFPATGPEPLSFRSSARSSSGAGAAIPTDAASLLCMDVKPCRLGGQQDAPPLVAALTRSHLFVYGVAAEVLEGRPPPPPTASTLILGPSAPSTSTSALFSCRL